MRNDLIPGKKGHGPGASNDRGKRVTKDGQLAGPAAIRAQNGHAPAMIAAERRIRRIQTLRRMRAELFSADLFSEPAWEMLLELYLCEMVNQRIAVSSLCAAALAPTTTALRWLGKLESDGWIVREGDPNDARRTFVELTDRGRDSMERFLKLVDFQSVG